MTALKYFTDEMPCRRGDYNPIEKLAKELAGGIGPQGIPRGSGDIQLWIPPVKTPIDYPEGKNRQTAIPLGYDGAEAIHAEVALTSVTEYYGTDLTSVTDFDDHWPGLSGGFKWNRTRCWPVCHHSCDRCPTKPDYHYITGSPGRNKPPIPDPKGHRLPDETVINKMTFDEQPWLDTAPLDVQAKAGYTNFGNDLDAEGNPLPGEYWAEEDRQHRKASAPKLCSADASRPPKPLRDSVASLRGRQCRNCLGRIPEDAHGKVRYCSERCRNRSEYVTGSGQAGTVNPGIELSTFSVDRKRIGIDTDDRGFYRLLVGVA